MIPGIPIAAPLPSHPLPAAHQVFGLSSGVKGRTLTSLKST
jgi:hypothetical protein